MKKVIFKLFLVSALLIGCKIFDSELNFNMINKIEIKKSL